MNARPEKIPGPDHPISISRNGVWCYEKPYAAVSSIAHHLAFYPNRVDSIEDNK